MLSQSPCLGLMAIQLFSTIFILVFQITANQNAAFSKYSVLIGRF